MLVSVLVVVAVALLLSISIGGSIGGAIGSAMGGPIGGVLGSIVGSAAEEYGWLGFSNHGDEEANVGNKPTEADIAKQEADKAALRRQRAAALLAGGAKANILTSPLGIPGGAESNQVQGRKTLLGS